AILDDVGLALDALRLPFRQPVDVAPAHLLPRREVGAHQRSEQHAPPEQRRHRPPLMTLLGSLRSTQDPRATTDRPVRSRAPLPGWRAAAPWRCASSAVTPRTGCRPA